MKHGNGYEILPHTADLKIRVCGKTIKDVFRYALIGMFQSIGPQARGCVRRNNQLICPQLPVARPISIQSYSKDELLIDFLSHALYLSDVYNEAYLDVTIHKFLPTNLDATLHGIVIDRFDVVEIKAVTYYGCAIEQKNGLWMVEIVFDI